MATAKPSLADGQMPSHNKTLVQKGAKNVYAGTSPTYLRAVTSTSVSLQSVAEDTVHF